jgi:hypothetical protein
MVLEGRRVMWKACSYRKTAFRPINFAHGAFFTQYLEKFSAASKRTTQWTLKFVNQSN